MHTHTEKSKISGKVVAPLYLPLSLSPKRKEIVVVQMIYSVGYISDR